MEPIIFLSTFLLSLFIAFALKYGRRKTDIRKVPPALPSLPIIGSIPFLTEFNALPKFLMKKSRELGPIFTMKIGQRHCVVLSDREVITEAYVKKSTVFAGRDGYTVETEGANPRGKGIIFRNFDDEFKRFHQLSLSILKEFGFGDKQLMETRITAEAEHLVAFLMTKGCEAFDPRDAMCQATSNVVFGILLDVRDDYKNGLGKCASTVQRMVKATDPLLNFAPVLRFFPYYRGKFNAWCQASIQLLEIADSQVRSTKASSSSSSSSDSFVSSYLKKAGTDYDHEQLLFTIRDLILAGTETTSTALCWSAILLGNHRMIQERVQDELDGVVPRDRLPSTSDAPNLPYTEATILEIMRFKTIGPLSLPRLLLKETELRGCFLPAGSLVFPNLYAVHMDPKEWIDPETFRPERFLDAKGAVINKDKVISFSLGRRSCLGEVLARSELFLLLTGLLQKFTILPPENQLLIVDKEVFSDALRPEPFKIRMQPRVGLP